MSLVTRRPGVRPGVSDGSAGNRVPTLPSRGAVATDLAAGAGAVVRADGSATVVDIAGLGLRIPVSPAVTGRRGRSGRPAFVHAATDVDLRLHAGRVHGLVGESGCGKSVLASTLVGLLPAGTQVAGTVRIDDVDVTGALGDPRDRTWDRLRGRVVGLVAQSSATFLAPTRTVGAQLAETVAALRGPQAPEALLARVGLDASALRAYPHELSGGMAGRAALAFALAGNPQVIVADEPTASLDPELTALVLCLLREVADAGAAVLLITHDLASLRATEVADDVSVMYAGQILEHGPAARVLTSPAHAYTGALLDALPERGLRPLRGMPPSLVDLDPAAALAGLAERLGLPTDLPGGAA